MRITAWFIVEYQGFSGLIQVVPWQTNIILVIKHPRSQVVLYHTK